MSAPLRPAAVPVHVGRVPENVQAALRKATELQVEEYFRIWLSTPAGQTAARDSIAAARDGAVFHLEGSPGKSMLMSPTKAAPMSPGGFARQGFGSPPLSPSGRGSAQAVGFGVGASSSSSSGPLSPIRASAKTSPASPRSFGVQPANVDDVYPSAEAIASAAASSPTHVAAALSSSFPPGASGGGALFGARSPRHSSPSSPSSHHSPAAAPTSLPFSPPTRSPGVVVSTSSSSSSGAIPRSDASPLSPSSSSSSTGGLGSPGIAVGGGGRGRGALSKSMSASGELAGFPVDRDVSGGKAGEEGEEGGEEGAGAAPRLRLSLDGGARGGEGGGVGPKSPTLAALSPRLLRNISAPASMEGLGSALGMPGPPLPSSLPGSAVSSPASSPSMSPAPRSPTASPGASAGAAGLLPPRSPRSPGAGAVMDSPPPALTAASGVTPLRASPPVTGPSRPSLASPEGTSRVAGVGAGGEAFALHTSLRHSPTKAGASEGKEADVASPPPSAAAAVPAARPTGGLASSESKSASEGGGEDVYGLSDAPTRDVNPTPVLTPTPPPTVNTTSAVGGAVATVAAVATTAARSAEETAGAARHPAVVKPGRGAQSIPTFFRTGVGAVGTGAGLAKAKAAAGARPVTPASLALGMEEDGEGALASGFSRLSLVAAKLAGSTSASTTPAGSTPSSTTATPAGSTLSDRHFASRPVLAGEGLEGKLSSVLEAFRKHNAGGPVPAHPYARFNERVRKRRASTSRDSTGKSGKGGATGSLASTGGRPGSASTGRPSLSSVGLGGRRPSTVGGGKGSSMQVGGRRLSGASISTAGSEEGEGEESEEEGGTPHGPKPVVVSVSVCGLRLGWEDAHMAVAVDQFASLTKPLIGFPSFFAAPLFRRIRHMYGGAKAVGSRPVAPAEWSTEAGQLEASLSALEAGGAGKGVAAAAAGKGSGSSTALAAGKAGGAGRGRSGSDAGKSAHPSSSSGDRDKELGDHDNSGLVTLPQFLAYWRAEVERYDASERFVRLLSARWRPWALHPSDFMPALEELLAYHPGLAFLEHTPEFQDKYARTVVSRIMFAADPGGRNVLDVKGIQGAVPPVLQAFATVDVENDINAVPAYFSYEHFYVLYCKFWELDSDHDFLLSRSDLARMTHLTPSVLDRVYAQAGRPFSPASSGGGGGKGGAKMGYEDFCAFFLAAEDKTHTSALRYWFNVADVDGDGVLTARDLRYFWPDQSKRMREHGLEVVRFEDVLCQFHDLLQPAVEGRITYGDFTHPARVKLTGALFSALWDLDKFQRFEAREAAMVKQGENFNVTQWDRYAAAEYQRLAAEEEDGAGGGGAAGTLSWG